MDTLSKFGAAEDSNSVVSSVWREVASIVKDKNKVNIGLVGEVLRIGILSLSGSSIQSGQEIFRVWSQVSKQTS